MGVVLAIDPGLRLGKTVERLTSDLRGHDVVIAASGDEALDLLDLQVPDLILFPLFLSPGDESRLQSRLDGLPSPAELGGLTLPLRAFFDAESQGARPAAVPPRWYYWFKPESGASYDVSDAVAFADAVRSDLQRPRPAASGVAEAAAELRLSLPSAAAPFATPTSPPSLRPPPAPEMLPVDEPAVPTYLEPAVPSFPPAPSPMHYASPSTTGTVGASTLDASASFELPTSPEPEPGPSRVSQVLGAIVTAVRVVLGATFRALVRLASMLGPASAAAWRLALGMPRAVWVAAPVVIILLTLGVTGQVRSWIGVPLRLATTTRARLFPDKPKTGTAEIQSVPDGAEVWMNGRQIGVTPMRAEFAVGSHEVELRHRGTTRSLILDVLPNATVVQRIEWAAPRGAVGRLRIESEPAGAIVAIDGRPRGVTPLTADDLTAGRHAVDLTHQGNTVHETVDIKPSKTTTLRTSVYQGWLALFSPIDLKAAFDGRPLVLDDQNRALLPAGPHELTLQNKKLGFLETRSIAIKPGETTAVSVELPKTMLTVTASGPGDVWIDGTRVGDAPIVDLPIEIGTHDVLVRSPEFGERRLTVIATVAPVRVAVDLAASAP